MRILRPHVDLDRFFDRVARARQRVLLLDYDGTLAPFDLDPGRAVPYPEVPPLLAGIAGRGTRIVLVSGRALADLRTPLAHVPSSDVWGAHGWQRRKDGARAIEYAPAPSVARRLGAAEAHARSLEAYGARIERKGAALAVHWRGLDPLAVDAIRDELGESWRGVERLGLEVSEFDGGLELRARARNKGHAVRKVLSECAPGVACAYLGDDFTDEDAFRAIRARGLAVLVRPALRDTVADVWVRPPAELAQFLERWQACARAAA